MMDTLLKEAKITSTETSYADFVKQYQSDERYLSLVANQYSYLDQNNSSIQERNFKSMYQGQSTAGEFLSIHGGSQPREIFDDFMQKELSELHAKEK